MIKTLLLIFLLIFAVSGICDFIYILKMLFFYPNIRVHNYALIFLKSGCAVKQINYLWQKIKWQGDGFAVGIIAIVDGIDTKEILTCSKFADKKSIILCNLASIEQCEQLQGEAINGNCK